ncbi:hypothetical protein AB0O47_39765 [Streptomyces noursei]|uniref:hypothetical protein n=1 Tax=Streptomyces noursei TaxID=1971 RepID=UPI00344F1DF9
MTTRLSCPKCTELEARGRAPEHRMGGGSAALVALVQHVTAEHPEVKGARVERCRRCQELDEGCASGNPHHEGLCRQWRKEHHVEHALGIVNDGHGFPLRFADMPRRRNFMGIPGRMYSV